MTNGLSVNDITPLGERPADVWRGRTGVLGAGVFTMGGSPFSGLPSLSGDFYVYDPTTDTWTIVNTSTIGGGLAWFNVKTYGAIGDGTTDDTTAINAAIAAFNTATRGVLYFPACAGYKVTAGLTTITASGLVIGDGMGAYDGSAKVSAINCTSQTAHLFTVTGKQLLFRDLGLFNTFAGTPSAGSAIHVNGSFIGQKVDLDSVVIAGFYVNELRDVGAQWVNRNVWNWGAVTYGADIQNTVNQDAGDWTIEASYYYASTYNGTAAIRQTGAGGGKLTGTKINGNGGAAYGTGLLVAIPTGVATGVLTVAGCSIENVSGDAIKVTTTGTGSFGLIAISALEVGLYSNNTGYAVNLVAAATGGVTAAGGIGTVVIDGGSFYTDGTARAAVSLTKTDGVVLGDYAIKGFNARYTSSGDTNTTDAAGSIWAPVMVADTDGTHWNVVVDGGGNAIVVAE